MTPLPQGAVRRDHQHEYHTNRGQLSETRAAVQPVGIDHGARDGKFRRGLMVVDHQHIEAEPACFLKGREGHGATIDRNDDPGPLFRQHTHGSGVGTIPFSQPVRNIDTGCNTQRFQVPVQQRARRCSVYVIITEDSNWLIIDDCL